MSLELIWKKNGNNNLQIQIVPSTLLINTEMQEKIDDHWKDFMNNMNSKGIKAWNGRKYRVESIDENIVSLSESDFKTVTLLRDPEYLSIRNVAVVMSLVITSDNYLVFGKRKNVGVYEGIVAWIAGGVEPIENSTNLLFENMQIELKEEFGLNEVDYDLNLDLVYKSYGQGLYGFHFEAYTKLSKDQVLERFKTAEHKEENSELFFYENNEEGINKLKNEKDMLPEVVEFFNKFYEIKY